MVIAAPREAARLDDRGGEGFAEGLAGRFGEDQARRARLGPRREAGEGEVRGRQEGAGEASEGEEELIVTLGVTH